MNAAGVIAYYVLDTSSPLSAGSDLPLTATSSGNTTFFLYGRGPIGEKTTTWNYSLLDGTNTPRQLTATNGDVTLSTRYTPWGDTLELNGTGNFTFGYIGGILDAATGLLYVGNGQYYDPATGRFLTRGVNPDSPNPYVPWNPIGAIIGPLALISLVASRKKGKVNPYLLMLLMLVILPLSVGLACGTTTSTEEPAQTVESPATETQTVAPTTVPSTTPTATQPPADPPASCDGCTATPSQTPSPIPSPTLQPPPVNPSYEQMKEYIATFNITLTGNWSSDLLANLWEALFTHIGYQDLKSWLNGRPATFAWGGSRDCGDRDACYGGNTPGDTITFKATGMVNPVINMLHEIGHLVDNLWYDYFTTQLETTEFTLNGTHLAGWNGASYESLPSAGTNDVRLIALRSSLFGGQDAWQQRGGIPHWEDWADIYSNSMINNINQATDLGGQMNNFFIEMRQHALGR